MSASAELVSKFNASTRVLITKLEQKSRIELELANLDRLKKRINLLKQTMGDDAPMRESMPVFISNAAQILDEDVERRETFFLNMDVRAEYIKLKGDSADAVEPSDAFVFSLIDSVRAHYTKSSKAERAAVYEEVKSMLVCCLTQESINRGLK